MSQKVTAIDIVGQRLAYEILRDAEPLWEDYPDIGEHDWERVVERATSYVEAPNGAVLAKARAELRARSDDESLSA